MASRRSHSRLKPAARVVSVCALLAIGGDHLYVYAIEHYSGIPTIGTLFLLNAIGGFGLAFALAVPLGGFVPRRRDHLTAVLAVSGIMLAGASLAALLVSENTPLFGFMESGYRASIVIAIVSEAIAVVALLPPLALSIRDRQGRGTLIAMPAAPPTRNGG